MGAFTLKFFLSRAYRDNDHAIRVVEDGVGGLFLRPRGESLSGNLLPGGERHHEDVEALLRHEAGHRRGLQNAAQGRAQGTRQVCSEAATRRRSLFDPSTERFSRRFLPNPFCLQYKAYYPNPAKADTGTDEAKAERHLTRARNLTPGVYLDPALGPAS